MTAYELEGFILQATRLSDSRWRLLIFTQEKGRLTLFVRTSPKKKIILEPFVSLYFDIKEKSSWLEASSIEQSRHTMFLSGKSLFLGWYINELLLLLLMDNEPFSDLYEHYVKTLQDLAAASESIALEVVLRQFEWRLLVALGYEIALTTEANSAKPILPHLFYECQPGVGLVPSHKGFPGEIYLALSENHWHDQHVLFFAKKMMRRLIDFALEGKPLKTRALYRSVYLDKT